jgi:hypothetical protein
MAEEREGPVGIGGWLLFFLIALGVITPGTVLISFLSVYADPSIAAAYGDKWPSLQIAEWVFIATFCAGAWFLVWRLVNVRRWSTVRLVIPSLWVLAVGGLFAESALISWIAKIPFETMMGGITAEDIRPFVFCTVWTLYFNISKRVRNTYPERGGEEEMAEVFG